VRISRKIYLQLRNEFRMWVEGGGKDISSWHEGVGHPGSRGSKLRNLAWSRGLFFSSSRYCMGWRSPRGVGWRWLSFVLEIW
jgi:hypothetical protein